MKGQFKNYLLNLKYFFNHSTQFNPMKKIKAAVAGLGFIGPTHVEALRRLPNVEVVGVTHSTPESTKQKAASLGVEKYYSTFKELIDDPEIDCVHISTPNHLHYDMAKAALKAGKHVICEKPLADTLQKAQELVDLAQRSGLVHAVHFNVRYYPLVRQMKAMREKGELGRIYSIIGTYLQDWLFLETDYNWRLETEKSGESRAIADIGSHMMDLIEYVSGEKIMEVMADFNTIHPIRKKPTKPIETYSGKMLHPEDYEDMHIKTEDFATVMLRFSGGSNGVITVSQVSAGRKNRMNVEFSGSKQTVAWCSESPNDLWIGKREAANQWLVRDPSLVHPECASIISYPGGHNEGFHDTSKQLFKEVYAAISEGKQPSKPLFPTFNDGFREQLVCEKILESNRHQKWVQL
jgi:predicted dehydrogenase